MSDKIEIKYKTSDNRMIILSERDFPEPSTETSPLEKKKLKIEIATLLALIFTVFCYVVLVGLQATSNTLSK